MNEYLVELYGWLDTNYAYSGRYTFDDFQNNFVSRCYKFGFQSFVLYQGDGRLRTIHLWKD